MSKVDKIKSAILQMMARNEESGCTEAEAMANLANAERLMEKYGINHDELKNVEFERDMSQSTVTQRQKTVHPVLRYCSMSIGEMCGVKIWQSGNIVNSFGFHADSEMATYLIGMLRDSMDRCWKDFLRNNPKDPTVTRHTQYWSFSLGFCERIVEKIEALIAQREEQAESTGTDLVTLDQKMELVFKGLSAMLPTLRFKSGGSSSIRTSSDAYQKGMKAGSTVNLNRPLSQGPTGRRQLT